MYGLSTIAGVAHIMPLPFLLTANKKHTGMELNETDIIWEDLEPNPLILKNVYHLALAR